MRANRKAAEAVCLKRMRELDASGINLQIYEDMFKNMTDDQFHTFMEGLISGSNPLNVTIPNYGKVKITVDNNKKMLDDLGYELYQHVYVTDPITGQEFLTPRKYMVMEANICRQVQTLDHKISVAKNNKSVDERTGQATGSSKSGQCSGPEFNVLKSRGLNNTIIELIKFRGGDNTSMRLLDNAIIKTGHGAMAAVPGQSERAPKTVQTMSAYLTGMMFVNNF